MPTSNIIFGDLSDNLKTIFENAIYSKMAVLVDENTLTHCYPRIQTHLPEHQLIEIKSGETNKNINTCEAIWTAMSDLQLDRSSLLINLGGGVIGDMGGFCAATFKRGIDFINIPTTLLAQVDASIGGKLGIDFLGYKNHIGLFQEPRFIYIDENFLETLPDEQMRSGFAEVIKHGLIYDDESFYYLTSANWEDLNWRSIIKQSIGVKQEIVEKDPLEKGLRKILNFGHTLGHAIESFFLSTGRPILHGEAVAMGMICESYLSMKRNGLDPSSLDMICNYMGNVFKPIGLPDRNEEIVERLKQDKKNTGNTIQCTLLSAIGKADYNVTISLEEASESIDFYKGF